MSTLTAPGDHWDALRSFVRTLDPLREQWTAAEIAQMGSSPPYRSFKLGFAHKPHIRLTDGLWCCEGRGADSGIMTIGPSVAEAWALWINGK